MAIAVRTKYPPNADSKLLWSAIETGDPKELEQILEAGLSINSIGEHGVTPLLHAACYNRVEVIRILIERGADVNAVRVDGFTPLLLAIFFGHRDIVGVLVENGADVTATTRFGTTPQMWATARGFCDIADYLQQRGAKSKVTVAEATVAEECLNSEIVAPECLVAAAVGDPLELASHISKPAEPDVNDPAETTDRTGNTAPRPPVDVPRLKDPPEIWDLVHENRIRFNPRVAFLSRITSVKPGTVVMASLILISVVGVAAVIKLKRVAPPAATIAPDTSKSAENPVETVEPVTESASQTLTSPSSDGNPVVTPVSSGPSAAGSVSQRIKVVGAHSQATSVRHLTRPPSPHGTDRRATASNGPIGGSEETADTGQNAQASQAVESNSSTTNRDVRDAKTMKKPAAVTTNSHLIDRPSGSPTKAKIIQWP